MPYFERLIKLATDCITLGQLPETLRDCMKASNAILKFAAREDASELDKTWKDWLLMHKKVLKMAMPPRADSLLGPSVVDLNYGPHPNGGERP
eukprot:832094-Rhodomonas_salina.1